MPLLLHGGPGDNAKVPFPGGLLQPPAYICSGSGEPYQHYRQDQPGGNAYTFVGACREHEHPGGYPHDDEDED